MKFSSLSSKAVLAFIIPNTRADKRIGPHNEDIISVLVGSLLGDAHAERGMTGGVKFRFRQSIIHKDYLFWLYEFFNSRGYCTNNFPCYFTQKYGEKLLEAYRFNTYSYTNLIWLYKLFYNNNKKKVIPINIAYYLTPLALAIWIMDDAKYVRGVIQLNCHPYSVQDVEKLINVLKIRYDLKCSLYLKEGTCRIDISKESLKLLRTIVRPHILPSMLYKIGWRGGGGSDSLTMIVCPLPPI